MGLSIKIDVEWQKMDLNKINKWKKAFVLRLYLKNEKNGKIRIIE